MDVRETAQIVAYIVEGDSRQGTPTRGTVQFWHDAIGDLDAKVCLAAVKRHARESTEFIRPAHVRRIGAPVRADAQFRFHEPPAAYLEEVQCQEDERD